MARRASKRNFARQNKIDLGHWGQTDAYFKIEDLKSENNRTGKLSYMLIFCTTECPESLGLKDRKYKVLDFQEYMPEKIFIVNEILFLGELA